MGIKLRQEKLEEWCNTKLKTLLERQKSLMIMNQSLLGGIMLLHKKGYFTDEELGEMLAHVAASKFEEKVQEAVNEPTDLRMSNSKPVGRPGAEDGDGSGSPESGVPDDESAGVPGGSDDSGSGSEHEVSDDNDSSIEDAEPDLGTGISVDTVRDETGPQPFKGPNGVIETNFAEPSLDPEEVIADFEKDPIKDPENTIRDGNILDTVREDEDPFRASPDDNIPF